MINLIAYRECPGVDGLTNVAGEPVQFYPDPDGSQHWLAEVTEEQKAVLASIPGYSIWDPAPPSALPDASWTKVMLLEFADNTLDLKLPSSTNKADILAAILQAQAASQGSEESQQ